MKYSPIIKICGIKTSVMLEETIKAGADMVGFVHFEKSPRHLGFDAINELIKLADNRIKTVILLVNPSDELLEKAISLKPNYIQLHGTETIEQIIQIKQKYNIAIIKALGVSSSQDLKQVDDYSKIVDLIILDAKPPKSSKNPGGMGVSFNWELLKKLEDNIKFMLSGGLNLKNVQKAISKIRPFGLDISSGVESERGIKDANMIKQFINLAKNAANN